MPNRSFDPLDYLVLAEVGAARLRPELPDLARPHRLRAVHREEAQLGRAGCVAELTFDHLAFGAGLLTGDHPKWDVAAEAGPVAFEVAEALFDDQGDLRPELELTGEGYDLLLVRDLVVQPGVDYAEVGRELLNHALSQYGGGCFAAAFHRGQVERLELARLLTECGFRLAPRTGLLLFDLGRPLAILESRLTRRHRVG